MRLKVLPVLIIFVLVFFAGCTKQENTEVVNSPEEMTIQANLVFFYYSDLAAAKQFYEEIIGLEAVLDYGFAKLYRVSPTTYLGLVDEKRGMHSADEPKTVTLAFVTDEVDGWYAYLSENNVKMRGPLGDATRHPTRGFVAYDPEGYFLEFETFLEHAQNKKLLAQLKGSSSLYPKEGLSPTRPENLGIKANVIWLYYNDIPEAQRFYETNFGSELLVDQGFAKVYSSTSTGFIGLVDQAQGLHRFTENKAVTVSFFSEQIDNWYSLFKEKGFEFREPLADADSFPVRAFVTYDPAGYFLEFDWFLPDERNEKLLGYLNQK